MARITQEDCLPQVQNRFELVLKAAQRARELELDEVDPVISADNDKPTVVALREIASGIDYTAVPVAADEDQLTESVTMDIDEQLKEQLSSETMVDTELLAALNGIDGDDLDLDLGEDAAGVENEVDDKSDTSSDD